VQDANLPAENQAAEVPSASPRCPLITASAVQHVLICTNPPFRLAEEFVEHALRLCPLVVMLLRLAFLESERRCHMVMAGRHMTRASTAWAVSLT
jgi:hypothetical protein